MRRIHKSMRPYLSPHQVTDGEIISFLSAAGGATAYVADKQYALTTEPNVEWSLLADGIVAAVPEGVATTVLMVDGTVKNIGNEEIWT